MRPQRKFHRHLIKIFLVSVLSLFLVPSASLWFTNHVQHQVSHKYQASLGNSGEQDDDAAINPISSPCDDDESASGNEEVCRPYSPVWQFYWAGKASLFLIVVGIATLMTVAILGAVAFVNRRAQYVSFVLGWYLLILINVIELVTQGAILVWLSFWLQAFFMHEYSPKLIAAVGIMVICAVFYAVVAIFKKTPRNNHIDGELVEEKDAPRLWVAIRELAGRLDTAPPDQIIAGIDNNFFVTESPMKVAGKLVTGRTLFVSIPLLRQLHQSEANAVLAHELAHLRGGDTASSAALGPKLAQYDNYCYQLQSGHLAMIFYFMRLYRTIFEFALARDSREREFLADRTAAELVSPAAIVRSLIKVAAYSSYRNQVERQLFEHNQRHDDNLGIAHYVASGLDPYARSQQFLEDMETANVPHPFDTHPSLLDRMKNVGEMAEREQYWRIVTSLPTQTWVADIQTAAAIEQRMWTAYEEQFAAEHEENLAYRYRPSSDAELAVVLKYFPPQVFSLKGNESFEINYAGMILPGYTEVWPWDLVGNLIYKDGNWSDLLTITHAGKKNILGSNSTKVKLRGLKKEKKRFKAALSHYWRRNQIMRRYIAEMQNQSN